MAQLKEPVLIVGIGSDGADLALRAKDALGYDLLVVSDSDDNVMECGGIKISTESIVNPSMQMLRGFAAKAEQEIRNKLDGYASVIMLCNLSTKTGTAIAPIVSNIAKSRRLCCFAAMPFRYEKNRIFSAGVALKRLRADSDFVVILDNDAMITNNPSMTRGECRLVGDAAILHVISSLKSSDVPKGMDVIAASTKKDTELSLRDSLKMVCDSAKRGSVTRSIIYVMGGNNTPIGVLNMISSMALQVLGNSQINLLTDESESLGMVMVTAVQGATRFDDYDPLGVIPAENALDWDEPDYAMDCRLQMHTLE